MTIFDELLDIARERHFGHETSNATERTLCRISRVPVPWCHGCRRGLHKYTRVPLPGAEEFELPMAEVVAVEVQPAEITPADATPPVVEPPSVKLSEIITDVAGKVLGVPRERIDCSALDKITGYEPIDPVWQPYQSVDLTAAPEGIKKIWADRELVYDADKAKELEQSLKDGVDEGRKP